MKGGEQSDKNRAVLLGLSWRGEGWFMFRPPPAAPSPHHYHTHRHTLTCACAHGQSVQNAGREEQPHSGGWDQLPEEEPPTEMVTQGPRGTERALSQRSKDQPNRHQGSVLLPHTPKLETAWGLRLLRSKAGTSVGKVGQATQPC